MNRATELTGDQWARLIGWMRQRAPVFVSEHLKLSEVAHHLALELKMLPSDPGVGDPEYGIIIEGAKHAGFEFVGSGGKINRGNDVIMERVTKVNP